MPSFLVEIARDDPRLKVHPYEFPVVALPKPESFQIVRSSALKKIGVTGEEYVAMSVYTLEYDKERNPEYAEKSRSVETLGDELIEGIDVLNEYGFEVVLLGSMDTGRAKVPREFPRLNEFYQLGSMEEVAVAAGCRYFWTDNVGAWWLGQPFQKPVLFTNMASQGCRKGLMPRTHMVLPVRYQTPEGRLLTFREMYRGKNSSFYKMATRGELRLIRNPPHLIADAHREMIGRLDGTWIEDSDALELHKRYQQVLSEFPDLHPYRFSTLFLKTYSYLLN